MKKFLIMIIFTALIFTLTACGAGDVGSAQYTQSMASSDASSEDLQVKSFDNYEDNLQGLINCMKEYEYISGEPTTMSAALIGAKEGYRYQFAYENSNVRVELYEYDIKNLDETAKNVFEQIKINKGISIQGTRIPVTTSESGKYLMIYTHDRDNDENNKRQQDVENLLKQFKS